jgi:hypothetical protein
MSLGEIVSHRFDALLRKSKSYTRWRSLNKTPIDNVP